MKRISLLLFFKNYFNILAPRPLKKTSVVSVLLDSCYFGLRDDTALCISFFSFNNRNFKVFVRHRPSCFTTNVL